MAGATYNADEVAALTGVSAFTVYEEVRHAEALADATEDDDHENDDQRLRVPGPISMLAIRIGKRRVVWPRTAIDRLLQLPPTEKVGT